LYENSIGIHPENLSGTLENSSVIRAEKLSVYIKNYNVIRVERSEIHFWNFIQHSQRSNLIFGKIDRSSKKNVPNSEGFVWRLEFSKLQNSFFPWTRSKIFRKNLSEFGKERVRVVVLRDCARDSADPCVMRVNHCEKFLLKSY
jgi:hypothetical protein